MPVSPLEVVEQPQRRTACPRFCKTTYAGSGRAQNNPVRPTKLYNVEETDPKGCGAFYSGHYATVLHAENRDGATSDFGLIEWRDKANAARNSSSSQILGQITSYSAGGAHGHNEVLALARKELILGGFYLDDASRSNIEGECHKHNIPLFKFCVHTSKIERIA
jgi:hypothetical protein